MGITAQGLTFFPLYWTYHDCWKYRIPTTNGYEIKHHWGHVHFWMMGFDWKAGGGDAFSGTQRFHFELQDVWGPRTNDPNQQFQYRVVGLPKWYFTVTEVWRRVYIQQWDEKIKIPGNGIVGRKGIKYDASLPHQTFGPFREGRGSAPVFIDSARGLPVEYFNTDNRDRHFRDNYIKGKYQSVDGEANRPYGDGSFYVPPPDGTEPLKGEPGGTPTYADGLYLYPTLEYAKVVQLNDERLPGYAAAHDHDEENFGDGWSIDVTIPFTDPVTGKYRSPFSPSPGLVFPAGFYFNDLVPPDKWLKNRVADNTPPDPTHPEDLGGYDYQNRPFGLPDTESEKLLKFKDPYGRNDGRWVQQCLGGIVQARAVVTIESKIGGRQDVTVSTTQYLPLDQFAGTDQLAGT